MTALAEAPIINAASASGTRALTMQRHLRAPILLMLGPALGLLALFVFLPMLLTLWLSLQNWSTQTGFETARFSGLDNFIEIFGSSSVGRDFKAALANTAIYTVLSVAIILPLSVGLGLMVHQSRVAGGLLLRTILFSTYMMPMIAVALVFSKLYSPSEGPLNQMLSWLGIGPQPWLSSPNTALVSVVLLNVWQQIGYFTVLAIAGLTQPLRKYPLIVNIHGGPHGQQGPVFNLKNQVYSSRGWATLMVNYRGSTGYGQAFTDAIFADQNGNEGQDVLYALSAAMRRNQWIDRDRLGIEGTSYGGQLSAWLITQTNIFKAAIPTAAIINLISYNYMTYYNQYEQMEWGAFPHQGNLMYVLWERSALKHVAKAHTPTMLMHGENDNDVPIAEAEQFYIALKDVGVDTIMVRYPREGHGIREPKHVVDWTDRSIAWYEKYF